jgi:hypothetical protein
VRRFFSFPNPVNETSVRFVAGCVALLAVLALALQERWLVAALAYGFVARTLAGPRLSPLALLATRVFTPRTHFRHRYSPGPPKRFAQAVGATFTVTAAALALAAGMSLAVDALLGLIVAFATLEAAFGICAGCKAFQLLMRLHMVPADVCAECANVWARPYAPGASGTR